MSQQKAFSESGYDRVCPGEYVRKLNATGCDSVAKELPEMPNNSNERIREMEAKLGVFVYEKNDEN